MNIITFIGNNYSSTFESQKLLLHSQEDIIYIIYCWIFL